MNQLIKIIRWKGIKCLAILFILAIVVATCVFNERYTHGLVQIKSDLITQTNMERIYLNWNYLEEKGVLCDLGNVFQGVNYHLLSYTDAKAIEPYGYDKTVYIIVADKTTEEYIDETELQYDGCYERVGIIDAIRTGNRIGTCQTKFAIISKYCMIYAKFNDSSGTDKELDDVLNNIISSIE